MSAPIESVPEGWQTQKAPAKRSAPAPAPTGSFRASITHVAPSDYSRVQVRQGDVVTGPWTAVQFIHLFDTGAFSLTCDVRALQGTEWGPWQPLPKAEAQIRALSARPQSFTERCLRIGAFLALIGSVVTFIFDLVYGSATMAASGGLLFVAVQMFSVTKILHHLRQR